MQRNYISQIQGFFSYRQYIPKKTHKRRKAAETLKHPVMFNRYRLAQHIASKLLQKLY
jgi:hypothetical protein